MTSKLCFGKAAMGKTTTAAKSFALSGGAAGSLLAAVVAALVVLGAILAFNGSEQAVSGSPDGAIAVGGAPEAAAVALAPATEAVAATPAPVPVADPAPVLTASSTPDLPSPAPPAPPGPTPTPEPTPGPTPGPTPPVECLAGELPTGPGLLPDCVSPPVGDGGSNLAATAGGLGSGLDATTTELLGLDLNLAGVGGSVGRTADYAVNGVLDLVSPARARNGRDGRGGRRAGTGKRQSLLNGLLR